MGNDHSAPVDGTDLPNRQTALVEESLWILLHPLSIAALYGVLRYTVLGRSPSSEHSFVFFAAHTNEFYREMFMNALLYFPLGLSLTVLLGPWSILAAFALSLGIESWQYFAGTGLAQGTDVIMNTFGAAIGALPWIIVRCITALQSRRFGPCK